jgi:hypothetical protein
MRKYSAHCDRIAAALTGCDGQAAAAIATEGVAMTDLLLSKNQDYGGSAWQVPTLAPSLDAGTAILVRMSDKIARLNKLLASGAEAQVAESIEDTLRDLAGYCVLYLARPRKGSAEGSGVGVQGSENAGEQARGAAEVAEKKGRRCINCGLYQLADCRLLIDLSCWVPKYDA